MPLTSPSVDLIWLTRPEMAAAAAAGYLPLRAPPDSSVICCGSCSSHIPPSFKLTSPIGRSVRADGEAGGMSRDTLSTRSRGRNPSAIRPPSRQATLASDRSRSWRCRSRPDEEVGGQRRQRGSSTADAAAQNIDGIILPHILANHCTAFAVALQELLAHSHQQAHCVDLLLTRG
jgi:hypothetical protein